jgi:hypothetical protein
MKCGRLVLVLIAICVTNAFAAPQIAADPYASLSPEEKTILKPAVKDMYTIN